jgi:Mrp family chromosome partitioning ATPase
MEKIRQALDRAQRERLELQWSRGDIEAAVGGQPGLTARCVPTLEADASAVREPGGPRDRLPEPRATEFVVSAAVLERNRIVAADEASPVAGVFRLLRTQVLQRMREQGWRSLGVTSARPGDGKTTLAANLGVAIAADPRHTALLVDLDLRRPSLGRLFGLEPARGIEDVLRGVAGVGACLARPAGIPNLRLLPARGRSSDSSGAVAGPACQALLAELKTRYTNRIVVVDLPPVLEADDTLTLAPLLDCVLFVVAEGRTAREDVARALGLLRRTPVVGTVLNRSVEAIRSEAYG